MASLTLNPFKRQRSRAKTQEFDNHQERLRTLSSDMLERYQVGLQTQVHSSQRLAQVYGTEFASADFKAQARTVVTMAASMLKVPYALVNIITDTEQITVASTGDENATTVRCEDGYCQNVVAIGRAFAVDNAREHALVMDTAFAQNGTVTAYLGVPIRREDQIIGVLCVYDTEPRHWGVADVTMLAQLTAVMTKAALANSK